MNIEIESTVLVQFALEELGLFATPCTTSFAPVVKIEVFLEGPQ